MQENEIVHEKKVLHTEPFEKLETTLYKVPAPEDASIFPNSMTKAIDEGISRHNLMPPQVESVYSFAKGSTAEKNSYALPKEFLETLKELKTSDEKLTATIDFMQKVLIGDQNLSFGHFWEARRLCLTLFKENIPQPQRIIQWNRYQELCNEAKKLKEIFEEQNNFFVEQIETAILSIEKEISQLGDLDIEPILLPEIRRSKTLRYNQDIYCHKQKQLDYLNAFAARITSLRKEVLKSNIRHKQKKHLLTNLEKLGDCIFPQRKEAISTLSLLFTDDVNRFIEETFTGELSFQKLLQAQNEIKAIQHAASALTLSTEAFSSTRKRLCSCWETVSANINTERTKQEAKTASIHQNKKEFQSLYSILKEGIETNTLSEVDGRRGLHQLRSRLQTLSLPSKETSECKKLLQEIELLLEEKKNFAAAPKIKSISATQDYQKAKEVLQSLKTLTQESCSDTSAIASIFELLKKAEKTSFFQEERALFDTLLNDYFANLTSHLLQKNTPDLINESDIEELRATVCDLHEAINDHMHLIRKRESESKASISSAIGSIQILQKNEELCHHLESLYDAISAKPFGR